jgi:DNA primase
LPVGEDPDSLVRKSGPEEIRKRLAGKVGLFDQIINDTAAACDGSIQDKARRIEKLKPFMDALPSPLELDLYRKKISDVFGIDKGAVYGALGGYIRPQTPAKSSLADESPGRVAERELIGLMLDCPELLARATSENVSVYITEPAFSRVLECMIRLFEKRESSTVDLLSAAGEGPVQDWLAKRAMTLLYDKKDKANFAFDEILEQLVEKPVTEKIKELDHRIRIASAEGDEMRVLELSRKKADLQRTSFNSVSKFDLGRSSV